MANNKPSNERDPRRTFLSRGVQAATVGIAAGPAAQIVSAQGPAPLLPEEITIALTNGRISTKDGSDTFVNTVQIRNGKFVAVGGTAPASGPGVRVIDLRGRTVV